MSVRTSSSPILKATRHFWPTDKAPCTRSDYRFQTWYHGTGIRPADHPEWTVLSQFTGRLLCGGCYHDAVLVVAFQSTVHPYSGDLYLDCEFRCEKCGKFTAFSYAEN